MTRGAVVRRIVLALPPDAGAASEMRSAVELARLLGAEVVALLIEDERGFRAVAHGFASEIGSGGPAARAVDPARLEGDYARLARRAERRLSDLAGAAHVRMRFERVRGLIEKEVAARLEKDDFLALFAPPRAIDRVFGPHAMLAKLAADLGGALDMPTRASTPAGAVVVIAADAADRAPIALGEAVAGAAGARLVVRFEGAGGESLGRLLTTDARLLVLSARLADRDWAEALRRCAIRAETPVLTLRREAAADANVESDGAG